MITSNIKALLIEDNKTHVDLIIDLLSESKRVKTSLETAGSLQQAQQLILANKYDLILADLSLPDSRYNETLKKLTNLVKETPIVAITSLEDQDTINGMIKDGAEDCIPKTQLNTELLDKTMIYSIDRYRKGYIARQRTSEFECLAEKARLISWRADARTWRFIHVSQSAVEILGYPLKAWFVDNFWVEHIHPDDRAWAADYCLRHIATSENHEFEYRMIAANGDIVWLHDIINVVREGDGPVYLQGFMVDITGRKQLETDLRRLNESLEWRVAERTKELRNANEELRVEAAKRNLFEKALKGSEEKLRAILDSTTSLIYIKDREGRYTFINRQFEKLFHLKREELVGKTPYDCFPREIAISHLENDQKVFAAKASMEFDEVAFHDDGTVHTYISVKFPLVDFSGAVYAVCGISTDITERKRTEDELTSALVEKNKHIQDMKHLLEFSAFMKGEIREDAIMKHLSRVLKKRFRPDLLVVLMHCKDSNVIEVAFVEPAIPLDKVIKQDCILNPALCRVMRTGHTVVVKDVNKEPCCDNLLLEMKEGGYICIPMMTSCGATGTVLVVKKERDYWQNEEEQRLVSAYVTLTASAIENVRLVNHTKQLSITDALTGVYNKRFFIESIEKQLSFAKRYGEPVSIMVVEIDHFKEFNDTHGHHAGDKVLQQISKMLKGFVRTSDIVCRYGGKEFAIAMPKTAIPAALEKANTILRHVGSVGFDTPASKEPVKITINIGLASFPEQGAEYDALLCALESAVTKARNNGGKRVETP